MHCLFIYIYVRLDFSLQQFKKKIHVCVFVFRKRQRTCEKAVIEMRISLLSRGLKRIPPLQSVMEGLDPVCSQKTKSQFLSHLAAISNLLLMPRYNFYAIILCSIDKLGCDQSCAIFNALLRTFIAGCDLQQHVITCTYFVSAIYMYHLFFILICLQRFVEIQCNNSFLIFVENVPV